MEAGSNLSNPISGKIRFRCRSLEAGYSNPVFGTNRYPWTARCTDCVWERDVNIDIAVTQVAWSTYLLSVIHDETATHTYKGLFTANELNWTEPNWTGLISATNRPSYRRLHRHDAFNGYTRQRHDCIGCSKTRTVSDRQVLNTCIPTWLFTMELANWCSRTRVELRFGLLCVL